MQDVTWGLLLRSINCGSDLTSIGLGVISEVFDERYELLILPGRPFR